MQLVYGDPLVKHTVVQNMHRVSSDLRVKISVLENMQRTYEGVLQRRVPLHRGIKVYNYVLRLYRTHLQRTYEGVLQRRVPLDRRVEVHEDVLQLCFTSHCVLQQRVPLHCQVSLDLEVTHLQVFDQQLAANLQVLVHIDLTRFET